MADTSTHLVESSFLQLIFSGSGATIVVCATVVIVALIIFFLSRRFPQISVQFGNSKLELKREPTGAVEIQSARSALASDIPTTMGADKEATAALAAADSQDGPENYELVEAVERQDRSRIESIFDSFKVRPIAYAPYELEVWKNAELLRAGFADARTQLERIEKIKSKEL